MQQYTNNVKGLMIKAPIILQNDNSISRKHAVIDIKQSSPKVSPSEIASNEKKLAERKITVRWYEIRPSSVASLSLYIVCLGSSLRIL